MHNLGMKGILILGLIFTTTALAKSDFDIEKKRLQRRYEDFYKRIQEEKRRDFMRKDLAQAHKKRRQQRAKAYDNERRKFVQKKKRRKQVWDEAKYEALIKKKAAARNQIRQEYIKQKKRLEKIRENSMKIPPEQDVGLEEI